MIAPDRRGAAYRQLAGVLRDRITRGSLPPGHRLPSEKDLHDEFGLARETVRRALAVLRQEGLIEVRHGHGTFVAAPPPTVTVHPGDSVTSPAATTVTRASGEVETYPTGTRLTVAARPTVAAAVIVTDGRVLMIRRRVAEGPLSWQFPAGEIEPGETPGQAAARETHEETGMTVRPARLLGDRVHPATGRHIVYVLCEAIGGTAHVADAEEVAEVAWCDRATLASHVPYPLFAPVRQHLDTVLR
ncbi:NUDIX domain-containing protein [Catenuloplanes atrovinosus]|uniref:8-oxo-dGTP pyrophosphatase MutT (NUDIX family)/DNA-binding transcriptional regulator YhcF (GntR family) n=1 Tax=Catenuloplanes atrovinosus TaxID=137266 RepID=A0AAE3YTW3_9ACTN|nr:NUDIX domain-containing protein [Catenuloplanes atrovinosus]MDR7279848.1 8-oxo-dGTP pyrophosphatase MutT (NUDIX family)/DNA-binding transcriptional regulator YhcF (GntR family) [Catenuloplanes atrovinosus]